ncbi:MAG: 50S ribosomal protein L37ae [Candidatus Altiarchaeota archaeon]
MFSHTKKVGSVGRYGPRIGRKLRHEVEVIERQTRRPSNCPKCGKQKVSRDCAGIWECRACNSRFTGGTFLPNPRGKKG